MGDMRYLTARVAEQAERLVDYYDHINARRWHRLNKKRFRRMLQAHYLLAEKASEAKAAAEQLEKRFEEGLNDKMLKRVAHFVVLMGSGRQSAANAPNGPPEESAKPRTVVVFRGGLPKRKAG